MEMAIKMKYFLGILEEVINTACFAYEFEFSVGKLKLWITKI